MKLHKIYVYVYIYINNNNFKKVLLFYFFETKSLFEEKLFINKYAMEWYNNNNGK